MVEPREWLIRKDGYFYRPNCSGYTTSKFEAGRYTKAEAKREAAVEPWHMKAIHQDDVEDDPVSSRVRMDAGRIAALAAEVERLTRERDDALMVKREAVAGWRDAEALSRTGAVKVKALEWAQHPTAEAWRADIMLGTYQVWVGSKATAWQFDGLLGERINETASDEEEAKAAAQADYERRILSALESAAPEGQQDAAAWQSQDLIESVSYVSKNFGLVRYEGIDRYFGQSTHKFSTGHGARYVLPEALNDFLSPKPVTRPAEQAVTEAMVDRFIGVYETECRHRYDRNAIRAALKAAMEAGR